MSDGSVVSEFQRVIASFALAGGVLAALAIPALAEVFAPHIFPALFLLVTCSIGVIASQSLKDVLRPDPLTLRIVLWQLVAVPVIFLTAAEIADASDKLTLFFLISATASSIFAAPALAILLGLHSLLAMRVMVWTTLLAPLSLLAAAETVGGLPMAFSLADYGERTFIFLGVPLLIVTVIAGLMRRLPRRGRAAMTEGMRWGGIFALTVFGMGIMLGVSETLATEPARMVPFVYAAALFAGLEFAGTVLLFSRFGIRKALTAGLLGTCRNLGLSYAVLGDALSEDVIVYIAIFQLPVLLLPAAIRCGQFTMALVMPQTESSRSS